MKKLFIALAAVALTACVKAPEKQSRSTHGKAKAGIPTEPNRYKTGL